jgi:hypothetical protein
LCAHSSMLAGPFKQTKVGGGIKPSSGVFTFRHFHPSTIFEGEAMSLVNVVRSSSRCSTSGLFSNISLRRKWRHDTQNGDIQHNNTQHNDTQYTIKVIAILGITTPSITTLNAERHNDASASHLCCVIMPSVNMLIVVAPTQMEVSNRVERTSFLQLQL